VADSFKTDFGIAPWITGIFVTFIVGIVIIGGIRRIGAVTSKLAPLMAAMYCLAALVILLLNLDKIPGILQMIVAQAFNPVAGVTGVAGGGFLVTLLWGVKRGLFSNEAGQGSAPIAHAAAKTDEPVREGVVAMLGPFIDTLVICTMTGLVILISGASHTFIPTTLKLTDTNISWVTLNEQGLSAKVEEKVAEIQVAKGLPVTSGSIQLAYYDIAVKQLFLDQAQKLPFTGKLLPEKNQAIDVDGKVVTVLYGDACRNSAPLTSLGFTLGLAPLGLGWLGGLIVTLSVFLFAVSTAISWSYYGDRCVQYLFGVKYVPHYKWVYLVVNYLGAIISLEMVWGFGDAALGLMAIPNLIAIILLYRKTHELTVDYEVRVMKPLKNA
jgi:AGCS family alanine or glycine:cation symporter